MSAPDLSEQIQALRVLRLDCAARSQALSERELTSRQLRLEIEQQLVEQGQSRTAAEKAARSDAQYLAHEKESIRLAFERESTLAEIEATRLAIDLQLAVLRREAIGI